MDKFCEYNGKSKLLGITGIHGEFYDKIYHDHRAERNFYNQNQNARGILVYYSQKNRVIVKTRKEVRKYRSYILKAVEKAIKALPTCGQVGRYSIE